MGIQSNSQINICSSISESSITFRLLQWSLPPHQVLNNKQINNNQIKIKRKDPEKRNQCNECLMSFFRICKSIKISNCIMASMKLKFSFIFRKRDCVKYKGRIGETEETSYTLHLNRKSTVWNWLNQRHRWIYKQMKSLWTLNSSSSFHSSEMWWVIQNQHSTWTFCLLVKIECFVV